MYQKKNRRITFLLVEIDCYVCLVTSLKQTALVNCHTCFSSINMKISIGNFWNTRFLQIDFLRSTVIIYLHRFGGQNQ